MTLSQGSKTLKKGGHGGMGRGKRGEWSVRLETYEGCVSGRHVDVGVRK